MTIADLRWEQESAETWVLHDGPDDHKRPRFHLAVVHKRGPYMNDPRPAWFQIFGDGTEHATLAEAKQAAEAGVMAEAAMDPPTGNKLPATGLPGSDQLNPSGVREPPLDPAGELGL